MNRRTHGSLKLFLQEVTGVNQDSLIAFLSDGQQLREDNLRDLAGAQDQVDYLILLMIQSTDLQSAVHIRIQQRLPGPPAGRCPPRSQS